MIISYPYKAKPTVMLLAIAFFGFGAFILGDTALTNTRGLTINGVLNLGEAGASTVYWILTLASVLFVLAGLYVLLRSRNAKEITLTDTFMTAPVSGVRDSLVTLDYQDILGLSQQEVQGQVFLHVHHGGGKLSIPRSMLPNKRAFEELSAHLAERVSKSQGERV